MMKRISAISFIFVVINSINTRAAVLYADPSYLFDETEAYRENRDIIQVNDNIGAQETTGYEPIEKYYRIRRDIGLTGGVDHHPDGGRTQTVGVQADSLRGDVLSGSISQAFNKQGFSDPISVSVGAQRNFEPGHSISAGLSGVPGQNIAGNVRGEAALINTPAHKVTAFAQHDRTLSKDLKAIPFSPPTNTLGVNYQNKNGATAYVTGARTSGSPKSGTAGLAVPLYDKRNFQLFGTFDSEFGKHRKPSKHIWTKDVISILKY